MSQIISDHQNPSVNVAVSSMCSILPNLKSENSWICVCNEFDVTRSQTGRSRYPETENSRRPDNSMLNRYEGHQKLWIFQFDEYFVLTLLAFHEVSETEPDSDSLHPNPTDRRIDHPRFEAVFLFQFWCGNF